MIRESRSVVIVTGGAGFIGSEVVRQLAARGERVLIVDNLVNGTRANLEDVLSDSVSLLELDIRDLDALAPHLSRAHLVYHLACLGVRHSVHSPHENHDVNATERRLQRRRVAHIAAPILQLGPPELERVERNVGDGILREEGRARDQDRRRPETKAAHHRDTGFNRIFCDRQLLISAV